MSNPTEAVRDELLSFLDSIEVRSDVQPGEITVEQFAERRGIRQDAAREVLAQQVKAGLMTKRQARTNGRSCWAYSLVKK
jgi:predicted ArsR family transcriptional regulator